jgi:hypothetical protein
MLPPLDGPVTSLGKRFTMQTTHEPNKTAPHTAAEHKQEHCSTTHDGKIVSVTGNKLVMSNKEGKECSHTLANDAKLTRDGSHCNAADLKVGSKIRVTTHNVATAVEALDKHAEFAHIAG